MKALWEGIFKKNPVFVLLLGLVPAVAIASTAQNGWVLGLVTAVVLILGTMINFFLTPLVPKNIRTVIQMAVSIILVVLSHSILVKISPQIVAQLGIFLPLIVVNTLFCYKVEEQEDFATATLRALGQGIGFLLALVVVGTIREFLAFGTIFGSQILKGSLPPMALASGAPGGLIIVGILLALVNKLTGQGGELHD